MAVLKSGEAVHEVKASDGMTCITEESEVAKAKFLTRFAPDRLVAAVSKLTDEQSVAACQMGFGSLLQLWQDKEETLWQFN
ncbi:hypothetical protein WN944_014101 [Citrus x changshan-huyou]|uniref:Uncharacterized protein n=1 Tax=Citrus x changshan-huyou TaxID=2935761 RepID=A0AAP0MBJ8_9ROSI